MSFYTFFNLNKSLIKPLKFNFKLVVISFQCINKLVYFLGRSLKNLFQVSLRIHKGLGISVIVDILISSREL